MTHVRNDRIAAEVGQDDGVDPAVGLHRVPEPQKVHRARPLLRTEPTGRGAVLDHRFIELPRPLEACLGVGAPSRGEMASVEQAGQRANRERTPAEPEHEHAVVGPLVELRERPVDLPDVLLETVAGHESTPAVDPRLWSERRSERRGQDGER